MAVRVYLAAAMSGRQWWALALEASAAQLVFSVHGIDSFSPVMEELRANPDLLNKVCSGTDNLEGLWRRDKEEIVKAHVFVNLTPHLHSHGVTHEIGLARYALWKPCLYLMAPSGIAYLEGDLLVPTLEEAAVEINARWGTWGKRARWRARMLCRSLPRWIKRQILAWR